MTSLILLYTVVPLVAVGAYFLGKWREQDRQADAELADLDRQVQAAAANLLKAEADLAAAANKFVYQAICIGESKVPRLVRKDGVCNATGGWA